MHKFRGEAGDVYIVVVFFLPVIILVFRLDTKLFFLFIEVQFTHSEILHRS